MYFIDLPPLPVHYIRSIEILDASFTPIQSTKNCVWTCQSSTASFNLSFEIKKQPKRKGRENGSVWKRWTKTKSSTISKMTTRTTTVRTKMIHQGHLKPLGLKPYHPPYHPPPYLPPYHPIKYHTHTLIINVRDIYISICLLPVISYSFFVDEIGRTFCVSIDSTKHGKDVFDTFFKTLEKILEFFKIFSQIIFINWGWLGYPPPPGTMVLDYLFNIKNPLFS